MSARPDTLPPTALPPRLLAADTLQAQGRLKDAEAAYHALRADFPDCADVPYNLGVLHGKAGRLQPAIEAYLEALRLAPEHASALNNLGHCLMLAGQYALAAEAFRTALVVRPAHPATLINHGKALAVQGLRGEAVACFEQALALVRSPALAVILLNQRAQMGDWKGREHFALHADNPIGEAAAPFAALPFVDEPAAQLRRSQAFADYHAVPAQPLPLPPPAPDGRLRIGYLSADVHDHATMFLFAGVLREHDRARFDIRLYSYGPPSDGAMRQHAHTHAGAFHDIFALPDALAITFLRDQQLDVLVDLKGFTNGTRSHLLGARLAPVQVNWLGYPGTLGMPAVDYIVGDAQVIPPGAEAYYSEAIIRLAGSYQSNDNQRPIIPDTATRADHGLPPHAPVLCHFNQTYKIGPAEFDIWMELLKQVPGSVLWLLDTGPATVTNLRREADARGVAAERLVFAPVVPHHHHLGRLAHADLLLDSFAFNAHTTASDALWAGVPVLTCAGAQFAARVGASLLHAAGLPELVTYTREDYAALALALLRDPARLADLRARLAMARAHCPLFDTPRFTRRLERALQQAVARSRAGAPPADFLVE